MPVYAGVLLNLDEEPKTEADHETDLNHTADDDADLTDSEVASTSSASIEEIENTLPSRQVHLEKPKKNRKNWKDGVLKQLIDIEREKSETKKWYYQEKLRLMREGCRLGERKTAALEEEAIAQERKADALERIAASMAIISSSGLFTLTRMN